MLESGAASALGVGGPRGDETLGRLVKSLVRVRGGAQAEGEGGGEGHGEGEAQGEGEGEGDGEAQGEAQGEATLSPAPARMPNLVHGRDGLFAHVGRRDGG